jgi:tetratricopeptide (TPR) repeat protein
MESINITDNYIGGDFNLYLKRIGGIDDIQRINDYFLKHGSAKKVYTDLIEIFTKSEGYFSESIRKTIEEVDVFLLDEYKKVNISKISFANTDDIGLALAKSKDNYKNNNDKLAYINYLQGCLLQIQFKYVRAYDFFEEACSLDKNVNYYSIAGELAIKLSKYEEAEKYFNTVIYMLRDKRDTSNIKYIEALNNIGGALDQQYKFKDAIRYYREALDVLLEQNNSFESNLYFGLIYNNLGGAYLALSDFEESEKYLALALKTREKNNETTNEIAITKNNLAEIFRLQKKLTKSENLLKESKASLKNTYKEYTEKHPTLALTLNNLGNLYLEMEKYSDAKENFKQALDIWETIFESSYNEESIITLYNLAITCWHSYKYKEALGYFEKASNAVKSLNDAGCLKDDDPVCKVIKQDYDEFLNQKKFKIPFLNRWLLK